MKKLFYLSSACVFLTAGAFNAAPVLSEAPSEEIQQSQIQAQGLFRNYPRVELLDPGAMPRQQLLTQPEEGSEQTAKITTYLDIANTVAGRPVSRTILPETVLTKKVRVTDVEADGDIEAEYAYLDAEVRSRRNIQPKVLKEMEKVVESLADFQGRSKIDARRQIQSAYVELPEDLEASTQQYLQGMSTSVSQLSLPIPVEEVGVGAKWRVISTMDFNGLEVNQIVNYELVHLENNIATLDIDIESVAVPETVTLPGRSPGATVTVNSLETEGQGRVIMQLDSVMPIASSVAVNTNVDMNVMDMESNTAIPVQRSIYMNVLAEDTETEIAKNLLPTMPNLRPTYHAANKLEVDEDDPGETAAAGAAAATAAGLIFGQGLDVDNAAIGAGVGAALGALDL